MKKPIIARLALLVLSYFIFPYFPADVAAQNCDAYIMGKCFSCTAPESFEISSDEICQTLCPNRTVISAQRSTFCSLATCPASHPNREENGDCLPKITPTSNFDIAFKLMDKAQSKYSILADNKGNCPPSHPLFSNNRCYPCDYKYEVSTSSKNLKLCPNRISISYPWNKDDKYIPTYFPCPKTQPLRNWNGECFSCDHPNVIRVLTQCLENAEICDVCPNRTILPQPGGNRPSVLNCPQDKPLMDDTGVCFSCSTNLKIRLIEIENNCQKACPLQRHLLNNLCIKNP